MKLNGTQKFTAPSAQVFNAILDTEVLKSAIPGAESVSYVIPNEKLEVEVSLPFPGLHGPFTVYIHVASQPATKDVQFSVAHKGKGGAADGKCQIHITDEANGSVLNYDAEAKLEGLISIADNPLSQGIVKGKLGEFFKNLEKAMTQARV